MLKATGNMLLMDSGRPCIRGSYAFAKVASADPWVVGEASTGSHAVTQWSSVANKALS